MSRKRILLVVEGKKHEVSLFRALFACYRLDLEYEIFPYGTNIYELYERMFADGAQDDLTLLGVLKERAPEKTCCPGVHNQKPAARLNNSGQTATCLPPEPSP